MKNQCRYKLELRLDDVNNLIKNRMDVEEVIGCLLDNYRFYNSTLQWEDWDGKHKVHFDEVIILEEYLYANGSINVLYGIKYRGLREEEQEIIDIFEKMYQEQELEEQEMEF